MMPTARELVWALTFLCGSIAGGFVMLAAGVRQIEGADWRCRQAEWDAAVSAEALRQIADQEVASERRHQSELATWIAHAEDLEGQLAQAKVWMPEGGQ